MDAATYRKRIEQIIAELQAVQRVNPPSSLQWQRASVEINRLAKLICKSESVS